MKEANALKRTYASPEQVRKLARVALFEDNLDIEDYEGECSIDEEWRENNKDPDGDAMTIYNKILNGVITVKESDVFGSGPSRVAIDDLMKKICPENLLLVCGLGSFLVPRDDECFYDVYSILERDPLSVTWHDSLSYNDMVDSNKPVLLTCERKRRLLHTLVGLNPLVNDASSDDECSPLSYGEMSFLEEHNQGWLKYKLKNLDMLPPNTAIFQLPKLK